MDSGAAKLFSVIIPTYNYGRYLVRAIQSVFDQPGSDYEILVVDDGSTDNTAEIVRACLDRSRHVTYIYQENRGLAAARNVGVQLSKGEFLLFLDADDALSSNALAAFRAAIHQYRPIDFVIGGWVRISSGGSRTTVRACPLTSDRRKNFASLLRSRPVAVVPGSNIIARRVFERLRFPETVRVWEDRVFYGQLLALYSGVSIDDPIVNMYRHVDSLSHNVDFATTDGPATVDLLFDPTLLSPELMSYRNEYKAVTQRLLFEAFYASKRYHEAKLAFHQILRLSARHALTLSAIKRYLKTLLH